MLDMNCPAVQELCMQLRDKEYALRNYLDSLERCARLEENTDSEDLRVLKQMIRQTESAGRSLSKLILALEKSVQAYRRSENNVKAILRARSLRMPDGTIEANDLSQINEKMRKYTIRTTG